MGTTKATKATKAKATDGERYLKATEGITPTKYRALVKARDWPTPTRARTPIGGWPLEDVLRGKDGIAVCQGFATVIEESYLARRDYAGLTTFMITFVAAQQNDRAAPAVFARTRAMTPLHRLACATLQIVLHLPTAMAVDLEVAISSLKALRRASRAAALIEGFAFAREEKRRARAAATATGAPTGAMPNLPPGLAELVARIVGGEAPPEKTPERQALEALLMKLSPGDLRKAVALAVERLLPTLEGGEAELARWRQAHVSAYTVAANYAAQPCTDTPAHDLAHMSARLIELSFEARPRAELIASYLDVAATTSCAARLPEVLLQASMDVHRASAGDGSTGSGGSKDLAN